ncbi:MAG: winged helix-turn-helix domain-containing protein [Treponema sp.]|nr:winged helix-turn-helix domain-containing protein [Treponema sp.]
MEGKNRPLFNFLSVFILLIAIITAWYIYTYSLNKELKHEMIYSDTGVFDLRDLISRDGNTVIYSLNGLVEYIPNVFLDPVEFAAWEGEILIGAPQNVSQFATSRMRILVPDDGYYALRRRSLEHSHKMYANGDFIFSMGSPGETKETNVPNTGTVYLTIKASNSEDGGGVIELIQQASNFVHRYGGGHNWWNVSIGTNEPFLANNFIEAIKLGSFLSLFIVFIFLFLLLRSFKGNLYFALFCLMWFLRSGVTGEKIFTYIFPALSWYVKFRIEYLAIPLTGALLVSLLNIMFKVCPEDRQGCLEDRPVLHKQFRYALYAVSAVFIIIFLFMDTILMSHALQWIGAAYILAILYIASRFVFVSIRRLLRLELEHCVFLAGIAVFCLAAINDFFYYNNYYGIIGNFALHDMTSIAMLLLTYCQGAALFIVTIKEFDKAKQKERTLAYEKISLEERIELQKAQLAKLIRQREDKSLKVIIRGSLKLDIIAGRAFIENNGADNDLFLTQKEFACLLLLAQNEGTVMGAESIYDNVWKQPLGKNINTLQVTISNLRKKIEPSGWEIAVLRNQGYTFGPIEQKNPSEP